jgi:spore coat polysaccharide biosynthesis protein SpsF (cytidylyltransferase family)
MKAGVIIQARLSSKRLPGKMMLPLAGVPLYKYVYDRCLNLKNANNVIIATSDDESDDLLASHGFDNNVSIFRGNLEDVLNRYVMCALENKFDIIVRVCGDSPFVDIHQLDKMIELFKKEKYEYIAFDKNACVAGLDFEIVSTKCLSGVANMAKSNSEREHVTKYIRDNLHLFNTFIINTKLLIDEVADLKLTVDEERDYLLALEIANILSLKHKQTLNFKTSEVFDAVKILRAENT